MEIKPSVAVSIAAAMFGMLATAGAMTWTLAARITTLEVEVSALRKDQDKYHAEEISARLAMGQRNEAMNAAQQVQIDALRDVFFSMRADVAAMREMMVRIDRRQENDTRPR